MVASVNIASIRWHYSTQRPGGWPAAMLAKLGLEALLQKWPQEVLPLGAVVGGLTAAAAAHLGLPEGLPVAQGGAGVWVAAAAVKVQGAPAVQRHGGSEGRNCSLIGVPEPADQAVLALVLPLWYCRC